MRIYLAARYARRAEMRERAAELAALGHPVVSRWIHTDDDSEGAQAAQASANVRDVRRAELVVTFTDPVGVVVRGGRHWEAGYAAALGLPRVLIGRRELVFDYLPGVRLYPAWADFLATMQEAGCSGHCLP